jgi:hypothetical protein
MRSSHRSGGEPDANPGAHRSDAACSRGIVARLRFRCMEQLLKSGWTIERARTFGGISENEARRQVTYARMHGLLASGTDPA